MKFFAPKTTHRLSLCLLAMPVLTAGCGSHADTSSAAPQSAATPQTVTPAGQQAGQQAAQRAAQQGAAMRSLRQSHPNGQ